ncbi:hypothetical protein J4Q44_G00271750 [Coregonus suidteri]|uniref:Uncharacterized protein n=1 Tax=Coregonus suidteri TaxID=861788 RepID=A0AAN8L6Q6_9TELE
MRSVGNQYVFVEVININGGLRLKVLFMVGSGPGESYYVGVDVGTARNFHPVAVNQDGEAERNVVMWMDTSPAPAAGLEG